MQNFTRECQSHWRKNFLSQIRSVASIMRESLRHKSNTFHTILALCTCLYRSHLGEPVSMKQNTAESRRLKMSTIHANTCMQTTTPLCNHCHDDGVVQQPPPAQQMNSFTSWICEPSLEEYPRCCSHCPPDSNLANCMVTSLAG